MPPEEMGFQSTYEPMWIGPSSGSAPGFIG
jgi:hypothetical protein